jgi:hypothetical protein
MRKTLVQAGCRVAEGQEQEAGNGEEKAKGKRPPEFGLHRLYSFFKERARMRFN